MLRVDRESLVQVGQRAVEVTLADVHRGAAGMDARVPRAQPDRLVVIGDRGVPVVGIAPAGDAAPKIGLGEVGAAQRVRGDHPRACGERLLAGPGPAGRGVVRPRRRHPEQRGQQQGRDNLGSLAGHGVRSVSRSPGFTMRCKHNRPGINVNSKPVSMRQIAGQAKCLTGLCRSRRRRFSVRFTAPKVLCGGPALRVGIGRVTGARTLGKPFAKLFRPAVQTALHLYWNWGSAR